MHNWFLNNIILQMEHLILLERKDIQQKDPPVHIANHHLVEVSVKLSTL